MFCPWSRVYFMPASLDKSSAPIIPPPTLTQEISRPDAFLHSALTCGTLLITDEIDCFIRAGTCTNSRHNRCGGQVDNATAATRNLAVKTCLSVSRLTLGADGAERPMRKETPSKQALRSVCCIEVHLCGVPAPSRHGIAVQPLLTGRH